MGGDGRLDPLLAHEITYTAHEGKGTLMGKKLSGRMDEHPTENHMEMFRRLVAAGNAGMHGKPGDRKKKS